jgi:hypothetical protein
MNPHWEELNLTIWKKAISAVTSAALLASLLATSAFAVKGGVGDSDQTDLLNCNIGVTATTATCSQIADGVSFVGLIGEVLVPPASPVGSYVITVDGGATFVTAPTGTGNFIAANVSSDKKTIVVPATVPLSAADTVRVLSPAAAGTSTVTVVERTFNAGGTAIDAAKGTLVITWLASSGLTVSAANSVVKVVANGGNCASTAITTPQQDKANAVPQVLCVNVKDGNGNAVANTASVAVTITPVGLVGVNEAVAGISQAATETTVGGVALFAISGSGLVGTGTISVSVTYNGATTALAGATVAFTGPVASIAATGVHTAIAVSGTSVGAVSFVTKDSSGAKVASTSSTVVVTGSVFTAPINGALVTTEATSSVSGKVTVVCGATAGTGTIAVKSNGITSNAITISCSKAADTVSVAFSAATVAAGGSATVTVTVKDADGRPAPDGFIVALLPSAGAVLPTTLNDAGTANITKNGVATWTFLAPFNFGTVTVLASFDDTDTTSVSPRSASINVGVPTVVTTLGSTAATLGVAPPGGSWSTSTKVAKVGEFITWRFAAGVANAGKTIGVFLQTKDANGVWSAPVRFSARVADSSGNAYFSWKGTSAMWVSIRGGLDDLRSSPPVQGRWQ